MATQWARLRSTEAGLLRRGGWYRVVKLTAIEAVLDVHGNPTPFPRQSLEIKSERPQSWTIVARPSRSPRLPLSWGTHYGVCPNCRERAPLDDHASSMRCPKCNGHFEIPRGNS